MSRKGQSTLEYALIIAVVLGGLLAMQNYMRRGVEGKLRSSTDSIGTQYSAGNTTSTYVTTQNDPSIVRETFGLGVDGTTVKPGMSYSTVTDAAVTEHRTTGAGGAPETITTTLGAETLYE